MMLAPGIHTIGAERYHADDIAETPSLSASVAKLLIDKSPRHAHLAHPRLGGGPEVKDEGKFDIGTAAHSLLLEGEDIVHIVQADSWRTNAAKEDRDQARKEGLVPLLPAEAKRVREMVTAMRAQIGEHSERPILFTEGMAEQTIVWEDRSVMCRSRLDWLRHDLLAIDDMKTTQVGNPWEWSRRTMWGIGADIQVAMNLRGVRKITGETPRFRFVVVESAPPYALSVVTLSAAAIALADQKIDQALDTFRSCLEADDWPSYTREAVVADVPAWSEAQWIERQGRDEVEA